MSDTIICEARHIEFEISIREIIPYLYDLDYIQKFSIFFALFNSFSDDEIKKIPDDHKKIIVEAYRKIANRLENVK